MYDRSLPNDAVFLGEVGLGGEVRPVSQTERRLAEAAKMGFTTAYVAERSVPARGSSRDIKAVGVRGIGEMFEKLFR